MIYIFILYIYTNTGARSRLQIPWPNPEDLKAYRDAPRHVLPVEFEASDWGGFLQGSNLF